MLGRAGAVALLAAVSAVALLPAVAAGKKKQPYFKAGSEIEIEQWSRPGGAHSPFIIEGGVQSPRKGCRFKRDVVLELRDSLGSGQTFETKTVFESHEFEGYWGVTTSPVPAGTYTANATVLKRKTAKGVCKAASAGPLTLVGG